MIRISKIGGGPRRDESRMLASGGLLDPGDLASPEKLFRAWFPLGQPDRPGDVCKRELDVPAVGGYAGRAQVGRDSLGQSDICGF